MVDLYTIETLKKVELFVGQSLTATYKVKMGGFWYAYYNTSNCDICGWHHKIEGMNLACKEIDRDRLTNSEIDVIIKDHTSNGPYYTYSIA